MSAPSSISAPICEDCIHCNSSITRVKGGLPACTRAGRSRLDLTTGDTITTYRYCFSERRRRAIFGPDLCGPFGKYFEPCAEIAQ